MSEKKSNIIKAASITTEAESTNIDKEIVEFLNEKTEDYYISLLQRYFLSPSSLSAEEVNELKNSNFLDQVSNQIDNFKVKKVNKEEALQLKQAEVSIQNYFARIGQLEFEKSIILKSVLALEEQKSDYLDKLALKYKIAPHLDFVIDTDTGEIKVK